MENNQLTTAEARAHMAQGPQYRVRDKDAAKYAMRDGTLFRRFRDGWDGISDACFDDAAHFTPYTKVSKRELRYEAATARNLASMAQGLMEAHRERAERAEARAEQRREQERDDFEAVRAQLDAGLDVDQCVSAGERSGVLRMYSDGWSAQLLRSGITTWMTAPSEGAPGNVRCKALIRAWVLDGELPEGAEVAR